jgi:UPF0755 protein
MKIRLLIFIPILVLLSGVLAIFLYSEKVLQTSNRNIKEPTLIKIDEGKSRPELAKYLYDNHLISNQAVYLYVSKTFKKKIVAGYYEIPANASMADIIRMINNGEIKTVKMTIPEGWRLEQIARKLDEAKILSYADFVKAASNSEGKLFPDTYYLDPKMDATTVAKMMTDNFNLRIAGMNVSEANLTLASIVEKEAANDTDRGVIAGIYQNRIDAGMKLQSDPTVSYGRDSINITGLSVAEILDYAFWSAAKTSEFTSVKSDFNTYQIKGLPNTPICNPGIASIRAAQNPTPSDYYYFLYGTDGIIHPSRTLAEHQAAVAKYMD